MNFQHLLETKRILNKFSVFLLRLVPFSCLTGVASEPLDDRNSR